MAVGYNPRAVTDGLVLALDAGNPKNYNAGISTNWTDKVGGNNGTLVGGTHHNDGPFVGAGYVEFDGTGDYLSLANTTCYLGANDFTVEAWVYWAGNTALSSVPAIISKWSAPNGPFQFFATASGFRFSYTKASGGSLLAAGTTVPSANRWYHVAAVKYGSELKLYVDGVVEATTTGATAILNRNDNVQIGHRTWAGPPPAAWDGYISNLRLVSTALYTSNFTPPTRTLTAVTNTVLLTCQGNTIADASSSAHTITANGDISLTKEPFGGAGAVSFDGSGDNLNFTNIDVGTGDFTYEGWIYPTEPGFDLPIVVFHASTSVIHSFGLANSGFTCNIIFGASARPGGGNSWFYSPAITLNTWHHIAYVRSGTTIKIYVDGVDQSLTTTNGSNTGRSENTNVSYVGTTLINEYFQGYLSNTRIIKGTALYTSNFTPPSRTLEPIENTVLLTCQGQNIKDASSNSHAITVNGDAKATIVSSSFEFDGTNDYVQVPNSSALQLGTGDFTIEMWWYMIGSGNCRGFTLGDAYDANGMELYLGSSGTSLNVYIENATRITADSVPSFDTWHHYVIERTIGTMKLYIDGVVQSGTYSSSQSLGTGTDGDLRIGVEYYNGGLSFVGDCKISNFKIYKGKGFTATEVLQNYNALKGRYA